MDLKASNRREFLKAGSAALAATTVSWNAKSYAAIVGANDRVRVGIVGCGHVGKDLAGLLKAFDCRILAHDILDFSEFYAASGVIPVSLDALLTQAEIVTLHLPKSPATHNILSRERLARMRKGAARAATG